MYKVYLKLFSQTLVKSLYRISMSVYHVKYRILSINILIKHLYLTLNTLRFFLAYFFFFLYLITTEEYSR